MARKVMVQNLPMPPRELSRDTMNCLWLLITLLLIVYPLGDRHC